MPAPTILVATWDDGLFVVTDHGVDRHFTGRSARGLIADGRGGVLLIVGEHGLWRRSVEGAWTAIAECDAPLSCCVPTGDRIFVGTDDARVIRIDADGAQAQLAGFDGVAGRERWYAGAALVDGVLMGPPLGIRSMAVTADGGTLLANVHVGGIPRSTDGGRSWHPTIDVDCDVHQVCAHPTRPDIVIAAAAAGLCVSRDAGATWTIERDGLHASYCSAVAFAGDDILVAASTDHFATEGAVYRRPIDGGDLLRPCGGGIPDRTIGIVDTGSITTRGAMIAVIEKSGHIHLSEAGRQSAPLSLGHPVIPTGLHIA